VSEKKRLSHHMMSDGKEIHPLFTPLLTSPLYTSASSLLSSSMLNGSRVCIMDGGGGASLCVRSTGVVMSGCMYTWMDV